MARNDADNGMHDEIAAVDTNEGRESAASRKATRTLLFTAGGRPRAWIFLPAVLWVLVAGVTMADRDDQALAENAVAERFEEAQSAPVQFATQQAGGSGT